MSDNLSNEIARAVNELLLVNRAVGISAAEITEVVFPILGRELNSKADRIDELESALRQAQGFVSEVNKRTMGEDYHSVTLDIINKALCGKPTPVIDGEEPIHDWFGLTYASYVVMPRTVLQSCSVETQRKLIEAFEAVAEEELKGTGHNWPYGDDIHITLKDERGRFKKDPLGNYERGRRRLWRNQKKTRP